LTLRDMSDRLLSSLPSYASMPRDGSLTTLPTAHDGLFGP
jgi:hypothetical protein